MSKSKIKVIVVKDYDEMSQKAAEIFIQQIKEKPNSILGLATGSTPLGTYKKLIKAHKNGEIDFSNIITFNLDEYYPIKKEHSQSYWYFMNENLFKYINIPPANINILDGPTKDVKKTCHDFEKKVKRSGGIDLQVLGIGQNGHIAFNEPGSSFDSRTRLIDLDENTIKANSRFFNSKDEVPKQALTMGLDTIMKAKKIILLASGENKAEAVKKSLEEPPNENMPASILQNHLDCTFIIDQEATSRLSN